MNENILKLEAPSGAKEFQSQETTLKLMSGHVVLGAEAFKVPFTEFVCLFVYSNKATEQNIMGR